MSFTVIIPFIYVCISPQEKQKLTTVKNHSPRRYEIVEIGIVQKLYAHTLQIKTVIKHAHRLSFLTVVNSEENRGLSYVITTIF